MANHRGPGCRRNRRFRRQRGRQVFLDSDVLCGGARCRQPVSIDLIVPVPLSSLRGRSVYARAITYLFELLSIGYIAALVLFLNVYAQLEVPRRWEWLAAITAMGGMGVVSLETGNVAILMNFALLAVALQAAMGKPLFN